jgi:hypothetical protein
LGREHAVDAWGRKISYRVYTGASGSLVQDNGANMSNCDSFEPATQGVVPVKGLCRPDNLADTSPASRSTRPEDFLAGKGLRLKYFKKDLSPEFDHIAYVLISHGSTGLGAYTISGVALDGPKGGEEASNLSGNMANTPTYYALPFSAPNVGTNDSDYFDDILLYRTISDLAKRANLAPRDWPDDTTASEVFNKDAVEARVGKLPGGGDTGSNSIQFYSLTVTALRVNTSDPSIPLKQNVSLDSSGSGEDGIGGASGDPSLSSQPSGPDEFLRLDLVQTSRRFALSLQGFGYDESSGSPKTPTWKEQVELRFFMVNGTSATLVGTILKQACSPGNSLASFSDLEPTADFNRVEIVPRESTLFSSTTIATTFVLSEVRACKAGVSCMTGLESAKPSSHCS